MKKREYITPLCNICIAVTDIICEPLTASKVTGSEGIEIGDGGENDDDAPDPTIKERDYNDMDLWGENSLW